MEGNFSSKVRYVIPVLAEEESSAFGSNETTLEQNISY